MDLNPEEIFNRLPDILRGKPDLKARLYSILIEEFPSRREYAEVMEAIRLSREESNRRFEEIQRRFEGMDRRFEGMDRRFDRVENKLEDIRKSVDLQVGGFQRRAGRNLDDMVAATLRLALQMEGIRPEDVKLRQRLRDDEGLIGLKGKEYEYDIVAVNDSAIVFEVKSAPDEEDVEQLAMKLRLVRQSLGRPDTRGAMVSLAKDDELRSACEKYNLMLV